MFAAGNNAKEAMLALMDAGGQQALSLQDNRGNNVLKYALDDSEVKVLLEKRCGRILLEIFSFFWRFTCLLLKPLLDENKCFRLLKFCSTLLKLYSIKCLLAPKSLWDISALVDFQIIAMYRPSHSEKQAC